MAVRRTFKQKQEAKIRLNQKLYSLPSSSSKTITLAGPSPAVLPASTPSAKDIFGYEPSFLLKDVLRTLITTAVIVSALLVIYFSGRLP